MKTIDFLSVKGFLNITLWFVFLFALASCSDDMTDPEPQPEPDPDPVYVLEELATGAVLNGANGLDIGPDGNLYIASVIGLEIIVMNRENGMIINRLGQDMGIKGPDDLVFGPDGSLYWTDILIGEVGRMTPEGEVTKQFVAPGVNPINFSNDGRLFVALDFLGDGLYELDPNLNEPPRPIILATEANPFPLGFLNAFDFGPDGRLYGPLFAAGLVISVDVDRTGDPISDPFADGSVQVLSTGFVNPASAKFDSEGLLTVLDQTGEVFKIDITTGEKVLFANLERGLDNMTFDTDGTLYMTNNDFGWVAEIGQDGQQRTISIGGMIAPQGLAVLPGSNDQDLLFAADQYFLRQFNGLNGAEENIYKGHLIPGEGLLTTPQNVSADGDNLLVSSWFGGVLQVFNPQSEMIIESYTLAVPIDAVGFQGDIMVSDLGLGGVVRASDNSVILPIDNATVFAPGGLATDGETLWVADWATGTVWQIAFEGTVPTAPTPIASGLMNAEGLAFEKEGSLVVVETGNSRLSHIDIATGEITTIVEGLELSRPGLPELPPTWGFSGVAVGQTGDIYISGYGETSIVYRVSEE